MNNNFSTLLKLRCLFFCTSYFSLLLFFSCAQPASIESNNKEKYRKDIAFNKYINTYECKYDKYGNVTFRGYTAKFDSNDNKKDLVECINYTKLIRIKTLRITSVGGDAWKTLNFAKQYDGKIDKIVVEYLCASSCANYLIPISRNIVVSDNSYIIIHGSLNASDIIKSINDSKKEVIKEYGYKNIKNINASFDYAIKNANDEEKIQNKFEYDHIKCDYWLHPMKYQNNGYKGMIDGYILKKESVLRCIKNIRVGYFWGSSASDIPSLIREQKFILVN